MRFFLLSRYRFKYRDHGPPVWEKANCLDRCKQAHKHLDECVKDVQGYAGLVDEAVADMRAYDNNDVNAFLLALPEKSMFRNLKETVIFIELTKVFGCCFNSPIRSPYEEKVVATKRQLAFGEERVVIAREKCRYWMHRIPLAIEYEEILFRKFRLSESESP